MVHKTTIEDFLTLAETYPVLDVRSPGEYAHACIPGAYSMPLFTDEERKVVGTIYKQQGREPAIKQGLDYFGPNMRAVVETAERIVAGHGYPERVGEGTHRTVLVHCWRGGMRSGAISWLLDLYGFRVYVLVGGYKAYRRYVLDTFAKPLPLMLVGGYTGSGKTELLHELRAQGHKIIDLEAIAKHRGSAFGEMPEPQPRQEYFENLLAGQLRVLHKDGLSGPVWVEDESQRIGNVNVPGAFWVQMRQSTVCFLEVPFEERLAHILPEYRLNGIDKLRNSIERIRNRLGGLDTKNALQLLETGDMEGCFRILLRYYDRFYEKSLKNRENWDTLVRRIACAQAGKANSQRIVQELWKTSKT
jgi:tRNA 2-selenouridine synthase